ncbi:MAG: GTPase Era [Campylobacteraceae bacterium]|nr:GTPase Era [Campylobacteraceae bacterium]
MNEDSQKAEFIAVVGKPNAGKSSLLNWLVDEKIAMVSQKANATRKRANIIVMHNDTQFIFVDTPGIHASEKLLNKFMLEEALKAMSDCGLILFLTPITDSLQSYKNFLALNINKPHIVLLTKCDTASNEQILKKIAEFMTYQSRFKALIPISIKHHKAKKYLLDELEKFIPPHPYFYDPELLTTQTMREIYKEFIREAIYKFTNDEIPYSSDVVIDKVAEEEKIYTICADIIVKKESQKNIVIGTGGETLKRIGTYSRKMIEKVINKKIFLKISVKSNKKITENKKT